MIRELITSRELTYKILANLLFMRVLGNRELNYQEVKIKKIKQTKMPIIVFPSITGIHSV